VGCVGKKVLYIQAIFIFISGITSYNYFTSIVFKINTWLSINHSVCTVIGHGSCLNSACIISNCISGVMVSVFASSVVDRGLEPTRMQILMMLMVSVLASSVVDRGLETTRMLILMMLMVSVLASSVVDRGLETTRS
jgi:hypothetical protein